MNIDLLDPARPNFKIFLLPRSVIGQAEFMYILGGLKK